MKNFVLFLALMLTWGPHAQAQWPVTVFEQTDGKQTGTYRQCIDFYRQLAAKSSGKLKLTEMGSPGDGYTPYLALYTGSHNRDPLFWNRDSLVVIMINNGIHPGEPDGIDASMLLLRDIVSGKWTLPGNVVLAFIPVYNIGGFLNRNSYSRVNQDGPEEYGFRGNEQNLDLNRDFTKSDSHEAEVFTRIFQGMDPNILIDNHVSDGADYQHVMTLLTTQYDKLGGELGSFLRNSFDPALYEDMKRKNLPMIPYVNVEDQTPDKGWHAFYDPPRFSSGYAALFQCIGFVPETHMLKPYKQRVEATYALMQTIITAASEQSAALIAARKTDRAAILQQKHFPLRWLPDTTHPHLWTFKGYEAKYKTSKITGQQRLYYDHTAPYEKQVPITDVYTPDQFADVPAAYIIPQGWRDVISRLQANGIICTKLKKDTMIEVIAYHIDRYQTMTRAYEKHYQHYGTQVAAQRQRLHFLAGDYIVKTAQAGRRFLVEMLEPAGDDSYFAWNFFDAVLQQKEGYSDYRWEDVAEKYVQQHLEVMQALQQAKSADTALAKDASAQLNFIYKHSPYYEPEHLRYPVFRIE
ncbi:M14 family metallopeptidase [Chitinophagaceae bacterium MMS25-I14]